MAKWFYVQDMYSGGFRKTPYDIYFIEATNRFKAEKIFTDVIGENPHAVSCKCCGANFLISDEANTLREITEPWRRGKTVVQYLNNAGDRVKVIPLIKDK